MIVSRITQHLRDEELRKARKEEPHKVVPDIRNDHLPSTSKRPNQLLRKTFRTGANEVWWITVQLGIDRSEVNVHEGDGLVVWSVVSFVGMKSKDDSAIEVFGGGVEDDFGHGCFVAEGSDEYDKGWTGTSSCTEGWKEGPGQEQREERVDPDVFHVLFLRPSVEPMGYGSRDKYKTHRR